MTLIEQIKLIKHYTTQALKHIEAKKYYKAYMELDEVKTHTIKAQRLIENNLSNTTEIPVSLELKTENGLS